MFEYLRAKQALKKRLIDDTNFTVSDYIDELLKLRESAIKKGVEL